jgi:dipeptidyl aminopeptidase/acylaminoacyl peptidase
MKPRFGPPAREREGSKQSGSSSGSGRGSEEKRQDDYNGRGGGGIIFVPVPDSPYPYPYPNRRRREPSVTFERGGQLWEVELAGGRPTLVSGVPTPIAHQPTRSPIWGRLAFISPPGDLVWITAEGRKPRTVVRAAGGRIGQPVWSPDDRQLGFVSDTSGSDDLYLVGEKGGKPRRLTLGSDSKRSPAFSSDGRLLYYVSDREGMPRLYVRPLRSPIEPNQEHTVPTPPGEVIAVASAKSNPNLVVCILGPEKRRQLWLIHPMARIAPIPISDGRGDDDQPALSPDGTRVAFRTTDKNGRSIIVWDRATGRGERLTDGPDDSHPTIW